MPKYKYNPPTRTHCAVCEKLRLTDDKPIIESTKGKASSASNYPIHNWYYFVLGYTPEFPNYIIETEKINSSHIVVDPFMGTGTTLIECKKRGIKSVGIDANDYFFDVVSAKTNWGINLNELENSIKELRVEVNNQIFLIEKQEDDEKSSDFLFSDSKNNWLKYGFGKRPKMLDERYVSDVPLAKLLLLKEVIGFLGVDVNIKNLLKLALFAVVVPNSNVKYGPGFGISKAKLDSDVFGSFFRKLDRILSDYKVAKTHYVNGDSLVLHGDARELDTLLEAETIDQMITSPPYPGDHEYTKHTRLELIFADYAVSKEEFRTIKKRMIRGSTTNIYRGDEDKLLVADIESISCVTKLIQTRLDSDGATSGFEKLYTKLVWEYFGGMFKVFKASLKALKPGGKFHLLVSDSHAFKMVHIETAKILGEVAIKAGYSSFSVRLWQNKSSTSHGYDLREDILTLVK
jgi:DNA modification methylase